MGNTPKRVLVTGGAGLIGSHIVDLLIDRLPVGYFVEGRVLFPASALSQALTQALRWHAWWARGIGALPLDARVSLSEQLFAVRATPDEVRAALMLWQSDGISFETLYQRLASGGWTREGVTPEQEREAIEAEGRAEETSAAGAAKGGEA